MPVAILVLFALSLTWLLVVKMTTNLRYFNRELRVSQAWLLNKWVEDSKKGYWQ